MSHSKRTKNRAFLIACLWSDDHNARKVTILDSFQSAGNRKCQQKLPNSMKIAIQPLELRARFSRFFRFNSSKNQLKINRTTNRRRPIRIQYEFRYKTRAEGAESPPFPSPPCGGGQGPATKIRDLGPSDTYRFRPTAHQSIREGRLGVAPASNSRFSIAFGRSDQKCDVSTPENHENQFFPRPIR